jgi:hypothetical protein
LGHTSWKTREFCHPVAVLASVYQDLSHAQMMPMCLALVNPLR